MLPHINPSVDLVIFATLAVVVLLGLALGQERLRTFVLTVYLGLVLAYELGGAVAGFVNGHGQSFTPGTIRLILFVAPVLLLAFGRHAKSHGKRSIVMALITSVLLGCLIITSALHLMDPKTSAMYLDSSQIATPLYNLRLVWLGVVPVAVLLGMIVKPKKGH